MLVRLSIRDIVLIDALDLDFAGGLTTLTGETGAGKSILLDAFVLALGGRGDASLVRAGRPRGEVRAVFETRADHPASLKARELGIAAEGELILRREQAADGRTRAFVNDTPISAQGLRAIGQELVEIHCQHDERAMVDPAAHRLLVDAHGGLTRMVEALRARHAAMQAARRALKEEEERLAKARAKDEYLRHAHAELMELDAQEGEEERLAERRLSMQRAEKVVGDLRDTLAAFAAITPWSGRWRRRRGGWSAAPRRPRSCWSRRYAPCPARSTRLASRRMRWKARWSRGGFDPRELETIEERLFALRGVARKHRVGVAELPALAEKFAQGIALIDAGEARVAELGREVEAARTSYDAMALGAVARAARGRQKARLRSSTRNLRPLKLEGAHFHTTIASDPSSRAVPRASTGWNFGFKPIRVRGPGPLARSPRVASWRGSCWR